MTLQYARLFQLRAGVQLIAESREMSKEELTEALRQRKTIDADETSTEGADDIIEQLRDAQLITNSDGGYRLTSEEEFADNGAVLTYSGQEVVGAEDKRAQADRILSNIMYQHPMLLILSKFIYRKGPVKDYEVMREFDGDAFIDDKMNQFTIDMGLDLLEDADVIESTETGYVQGRWPVRFFAHVVHEEYTDMIGDGGSVREPALFERLETLYGIPRSTFDNYITRLHTAGIVSEGSYKQLILNEDVLEGAKIHE